MQNNKSWRFAKNTLFRCESKELQKVIDLKTRRTCIYLGGTTHLIEQCKHLRAFIINLRETSQKEQSEHETHVIGDSKALSVFREDGYCSFIIVLTSRGFND